MGIDNIDLMKAEPVIRLNHSHQKSLLYLPLAEAFIHNNSQVRYTHTNIPVVVELPCKAQACL